MSTQSQSATLPPDQFVQKWAEAIAQVLGEIAGVPLPSAVLAEPLAEVPGSGENDVGMLGACVGALRGEMSVRIPAPSAVRLAQAFMSETAAPDAPLSSQYREALLELLRQASGLLATSLRAALGEIQIRIDPAEAAPSWPASSTWWMRCGEDAAVSFIELRLSAALVAALRSERTEVAPAPDDASAPAPPASGNEPPPTPHDERDNLQALMDVELDVALRFGSRRLLLREILDLAPGAVIELDRQVQEPVDLLLDGRVVARGEIVVMDGNYGLRVIEVAPAAR